MVSACAIQQLHGTESLHRVQPATTPAAHVLPSLPTVLLVTMPLTIDCLLITLAHALIGTGIIQWLCVLDAITAVLLALLPVVAHVLVVTVVPTELRMLLPVSAILAIMILALFNYV